MLKRRIVLILLIVIMCICFMGAVSLHDSMTVENAIEAGDEIIGNDSTGSVKVIKNLGNPDGEKIAYVVGVHPLENDTHKTFLNQFLKMDNLNHSYDVYIINVSEDFSSYGELLPDDEPGRATGQDLALKYVYPEIVNGSYKMAVDVHAHGGAYGDHNTFVFSPVSGSEGETLGAKVSNMTENISYYDPEYTTSGPYLTVPLNENGVPAFYFEENSFYSQDLKDLHMLELINAVDKLSFA